MSMHISVVSIQGDHLGEITDVLRNCRYVIEDTVTVLTGEQAARGLNWNPDRNRVAKAAYYASGWTFLVDPELVLMTNDVWLECSQQWNNRVFGWVCEGASCTYGLAVFDSGSKRREVFSSDGEIVVNVGVRLPEETDINWKEAGEDEILEIAKRLGAEYNPIADHLDESQM